MSDFVTNAFGFVIVLGFLVFIHEAGHFLFAKLFRVRVLVFSFGFGKRLFGFQKGDTDYRVSLIPLGGYVKMAGDNPEENTDSDPRGFLSKPKWQRFLILVAGPLMNLIIAIVFLAGFFMAGSEVEREARPVIGLVVPNQPAARAGLKVGDEIVSVNGEEMKGFSDLKLAISMHPGTAIRMQILRGGRPQMIEVTPQRQDTEYGVAGVIGIAPFVDTEVGKVHPGSAAEAAGLKTGDRIVAVGGTPTRQITEVVEALQKVPETSGVPLRVARAGQQLDLAFPAKSAKGLKYPGFTLPTEFRQYSFGAAIAESLRQNNRMLKYTFVTLKRLFQAQGSVKELSGPLDIARISGEMLRTGWREVIFLMSMISLQLGVMNLLPVPMLDGGHIFILLVEGAARRDLSLRVKERIQQVGFVALALLMIVVIYNDVIKNVMRMRAG